MSASFDLPAWLGALGLSQYADAFKANGVDRPQILAALSNDELKEIGVASLGHRKLLLLEAAKLAPQTPAAASASPIAPTAPQPQQRAQQWPAAKEIRTARWAYTDPTREPFFNGDHCVVLQPIWCPLDWNNAAIQMVSVNNKGEANDSFDIYSIEKGGITRRIPLDARAWAKDNCMIRGFDLLNESHMVAWGCNSRVESNDGYAVGVWDALKGTRTAGYVKDQNPDGSFRHGCIVNETTAFVTTYRAASLFNTERGWIERRICTVDHTNEFTWIFPRLHTPTGPMTVVTGNAKGYIDIWDVRTKLGSPSRSIPTGLSVVSQISWHPVAPDLIAFCGWRHKDVHIVSVSTGNEIARFECSRMGATGVGLYGETLAVGTDNSFAFFNTTMGKEPIGELVHTTVSCGPVHNIYLRHDRGIAANGEHFLCGFVYN